MNTIGWIAGHELRHIIREPQFFIPYILVPFLMLAGYGLVAANHPPNHEEDAYIARLLILFVGVIMSGMSLALCADSFAGEKERRTLETLFCTPVSLRAIFLGKLAGILLIPVITGWLGQTLVIGLAATRSYNFPSGALLFCAFLLTPVSGLLLTAITVGFSLRMATVRSTAQISGLCLLCLLIAVQGLAQWFFSGLSNAVLVLLVMLTLSMVIISRSMLRFERILYK
jgi:ABC-type Na+ efflux pump permease subunit